MTLQSALFTILLASPVLAVEVPSVTYLGRITNWAGMEASLVNPNARIQAFRSDNNALLASTSIDAIGQSRYNYALHVPMTLTADESYGQQGISIYFKAKIDHAIYLSPRLILPQAGSLVKYDIAFATDANNNGVADEYEADVEAFDMPAAGIEGPYDADADYDGDGISNRDEYYAGTDAFWSKDRLAITHFKPKGEEGYTEVAFIASNGRNYRIKSGEHVEDEALGEVAFSLEPIENSKTYERFNAEGDQTVKVYLLPLEAKARFIRVAVDVVPIEPSETP